MEQERILTPDYYGGKDNPYEVRKVIRKWGLNFNLGNTIKYVVRAGKKDKSREVEDLKKAVDYLLAEIHHLETGE